jgi:hypothetical protein
MATTPEGRVKAKVSEILKSYAPYVAYFMPVPAGYGKAMLDYHGTVLGMSFAIETKAPGKKPTPRQKLTIKYLRDAGEKVFIIDGRQEDLDHLCEWIEQTMRDRAYVIGHKDFPDVK